MCGIAGFLHRDYSTHESLESIAHRMGDAIRYRGPDDGGVWVDENQQLGLSHRRLSIVDLSPMGAQPMHDHDDSHVIVYNGEVYNFKEIRKRLEETGVIFRGDSDTEVILESCAKWGVEETAKSLIGMFAFALWNKKDHTLTLVRDRIGIKPLYWSMHNGVFLFASEIKALQCHPVSPDEINRDAIADYLRFGFIAGENSAYQHIQRLQPGSILVLAPQKQPSIKAFWSLKDVVKEKSNNPYSGTAEDAVNELESLIGDAVGRRMISDVPLGAFLSGGIDSSLVVAMMQQRSASPVKTFSIGFDEEKYNEAGYAAEVAKHLGTDHTELYVTAQDAQDVIPKLVDMFDEPFGDPSQIPTYLVSALTREHVTVALSGDGGDELFAGYRRYFKANEYQKIFRQPSWLMNLEADAISRLSSARINKLGRFLPPRLRSLLSGDKVYRLPDILRDGHAAGLYKSILSHSDQPNKLLLEGSETSPDSWDFARNYPFNDQYGFMQYLDTLNYLPDDILTKVDRASMAVSLEARVPLLDHRVVEFSWSLPVELKVRDGSGKWILKEILYRHVPKSMLDRPKMGFGVPIGVWLKTSLRDWAESLLSEECLKETAVLQPEPIRRKWAEHLSGTFNWEYHLWDVLMLQAWLLKNR